MNMLKHVNVLKQVLLWIRSNLLRRRIEREMREEMSAHLDRATERLLARGMSPGEARRQAEREFGNMPYLREEARYARGTLWLDALTADVRFAFRHFGRRPVTTIVMFIVLAVGMSISTLMFSFVHSYSTQAPIGVEGADDLVRIRGSQSAGSAGRGVRPFTEDEFLAYRSMSDHFAAVAGWNDVTAALIADDDVERRVQDARISFVTENYFAVLGVQPALGPGLPTAENHDPAPGAVAVIGHDTWDHLFAKDTDVIGSTLTVNGVIVTVVGVAPEPFIGMTGYRQLQLWMPLATHRQLVAELPESFRAFARLRPGVTMREATAVVQSVALRTVESAEELREVEPASDVVPLLAANGDPMFDRDVKLQTFSIGLLALLVLLVTCTNVSALLTGLATSRRQEIAIRLSLGAARTRIIRQLLTESAMLATVAASAALGIVWLVLDTATRLLPFLPMKLGITWTATSFTFGIALAVGVLFGLSPALHATRLALATALKDSTAIIAVSRARLQRGLVVAQIAFTQPLIVLLAATLVLVLGSYQSRGRALHPDRVIALDVSPTSQIMGRSGAQNFAQSSGQGAGSGAAESAEAQHLRVTMQQLVERLSTVPRVEAAVLDHADVFWLGTYIVHDDDRIRDVTQDAVSLVAQSVEGGYFEILDVPMLRGREFAPAEISMLDSPQETPAIISAALGRRLWAGADPIGRRIRAVDDSATGRGTLVVVGVTDDPVDEMKEVVEDYRVFLPPDTGRMPTGLLVRTDVPAAPLMAGFRTIVQDAVPGAVINARTIADIEDEHARRYRVVTTSILTAGMMALLLSALGLYAVVAFSVSQRTREIAVRMAVGAAGPHIARKFVADGLRLSVIGLALGLPVSLLGLSLLMGVGGDVPQVGLGPVTAIVALGVVVVATTASWIPARRAVLVDPAITLRSE